MMTMSFEPLADDAAAEEPLVEESPELLPQAAVARARAAAAIGTSSLLMREV